MWTQLSPPNARGLSHGKARHGQGHGYAVISVAFCLTACKGGLALDDPTVLCFFYFVLPSFLSPPP